MITLLLRICFVALRLLVLKMIEQYDKLDRLNGLVNWYDAFSSTEEGLPISPSEFSVQLWQRSKNYRAPPNMISMQTTWYGLKDSSSAYDIMVAMASLGILCARVCIRLGAWNTVVLLESAVLFIPVWPECEYWWTKLISTLLTAFASVRSGMYETV